MRLPRFVSILFALLIALAVSPVIATPAHADPVPAPYSGSTHGDILSVSAQAAGVDLTNLAVAHSATATDSTATPRTHAESANLDAVVAGVPILLNADEANAGPVVPFDSYAGTLAEVDVPGILDTGIISGSGTARWAGDAACVPDGTPLAQSSTTLASATVGIPAVLEIAGAVEVHLDRVGVGGHRAGRTVRGRGDLGRRENGDHLAGGRFHHG